MQGYATKCMENTSGGPPYIDPFFVFVFHCMLSYSPVFAIVAKSWISLDRFFPHKTATWCVLSFLCFSDGFHPSLLPKGESSSPSIHREGEEGAVEREGRYTLCRVVCKQTTLRQSRTVQGELSTRMVLVVLVLVFVVLGGDFRGISTSSGLPLLQSSTKPPGTTKTRTRTPPRTPY